MITTYASLSGVVRVNGADAIQYLAGNPLERMAWIHPGARDGRHGIFFDYKNSARLPGLMMPEKSERPTPKKNDGQSVSPYFVQPTTANTVHLIDGISTICVADRFCVPEHFAAALGFAGVTDAVLTLRRTGNGKDAFPYLRTPGLTSLVQQFRELRTERGEGPGWRVREERTYRSGPTGITVFPYDGLHITYTARVPGNGVVTSEWAADDRALTDRVASARALAWTDVVTPEKAEKYGFTGEHLLFYDEHLINPVRGGPREFADHKLQDFLGALWLLFPGIRGRFAVENSSHEHDLAALASFADPDIIGKG